MVRPCMTANGACSLVLFDDVTADRSIKMNCDVYRALLSAHIQWNATKVRGRHFRVQMDNNEHAVKAAQLFLKKMKLCILQWPSKLSDFSLRK